MQNSPFIPFRSQEDKREKRIEEKAEIRIGILEEGESVEK
jgi:hypothetical protein